MSLDGLPKTVPSNYDEVVRDLLEMRADPTKKRAYELLVGDFVKMAIGQPLANSARTSVYTDWSDVDMELLLLELGEIR